MSATNPISINITQKTRNIQELQKLNTLLQRTLSELNTDTDPAAPAASDFEFGLTVKW
ncbi:TPA: hypothetical protein ACHVJ6_002900 [Bacillus cereus]